MKERVRIGVIGAGAISQLAHLPVISKMRGAELAAICDNDRPKARALADRFGIRDTFTDIEDLLELDDLDAVLRAVSLPIQVVGGLSVEQAVEAARRGARSIVLGGPLVPGDWGSGLEATLKEVVERVKSMPP